MAKVFTICQHRLNIVETKLATQIINVFVCACNFRNKTSSVHLHESVETYNLVYM